MLGVYQGSIFSPMLFNIFLLVFETCWLHHQCFPMMNPAIGWSSFLVLYSLWVTLRIGSVCQGSEFWPSMNVFSTFPMEEWAYSCPILLGKKDFPWPYLLSLQASHQGMKSWPSVGLLGRKDSPLVGGVRLGHVEVVRPNEFCGTLHCPFETCGSLQNYRHSHQMKANMRAIYMADDIDLIDCISSWSVYISSIMNPGIIFTMFSFLVLFSTLWPRNVF